MPLMTPVTPDATKDGLSLKEILGLRPGTPILGLGGGVHDNNKLTSLRLDGWSPTRYVRVILPIEVFPPDAIYPCLANQTLIQHNLSVHSQEELLRVLRAYEPSCRKNMRQWYSNGDKWERNSGTYSLPYELMHVNEDNLVFGLVLGPVILMREGNDEFALAMKMFLNDRVAWIFLKSANENEPMRLQ